MLYISNAFALSMLDRDHPLRSPMPISWQQAADICDQYENVISAFGHADIAEIVSDIFGRKFEVNRVSIKLGYDDRLIVAQYVGPRLPEGATSLPEGAQIEFWLI